MKKRVVSILLVLCMALMLLPGTVWAAETGKIGSPETEAAGEEGDSEDDMEESELLTKDSDSGKYTTVDEETITSEIDFEASLSAVAENGSQLEVVSEESKESAGRTVIASGFCGAEGDGSNLTWTLDDEGLLNITGTGEMGNYSKVDVDPVRYDSPWYMNCDSITSVNIENGVTSIGMRAFIGCSNLKDINISESVATVRDLAFWGCKSLTSFSVAEGNQNYCSEEGVLFSANKRTLIRYPVEKEGSYSIPEEVSFIDGGAFLGCGNLTNITIPEGIKNIPGFANCSSLTSITIPEGVTTIGSGKFAGCSSLMSITLPKGITTIGSRAFADCNSLTSIMIPEGVTAIEEETFYGCGSLKNVVIPEGVTSIGNGAFSRCGDLENIDLPNSLTTIGHNAFSICGLMSVTIPDGVTTIERETFSYCGRLKNVDIPDSVTAIGHSAFKYCGLTTLMIPDGVKTIERDAFNECRDLKNVDISNSVTAIGYGAFTACVSLTDITFSERLTTIEDHAFSECISLKSVHLPDSVRTIEYAAFYGCSSLTDIDIPGNTRVIGDRVFYDCNRLAHVYFSGTRAQWRSANISSLGNEALGKAKIHCIDDPTVSYDGNGGSGNMESITLTMSDVYSFPVCGFTAPAGKTFKAWSVNGVEYAPGVVHDVSVDITVLPVWKGADSSASQGYTLTGTITGHKGVAYVSVSARLVGLDGEAYLAVIEGGDSLDGTDKKKCTYSVLAPAGQYSLEVEAKTAQGVIVNRTALVKLTGNGQVKNINLPNGQAKSKVNVKKSGTTALVGGLDDLILDNDDAVIGGTPSEVTFTIDDVNHSAQEAVAIRNAASGRKLDFFEFSVEKNGNKITDTGSVTLEIVLPFECSGKDNVKVYRYHDEEVDTLTEQEVNGEKIEIASDSITIYAKKFSVYAVGYTVSGSSGSSSKDSQGASHSASGSSSGGNHKVIDSITTGNLVTAAKTKWIDSIRVQKPETSQPDTERNKAGDDSPADATEETGMTEQEDTGSSEENEDVLTPQTESGISVWGIVGLCVLLIVGVLVVIYIWKKRQHDDDTSV